MLLSDAVGAVRAVGLLLLSETPVLLSGAVRWCCRRGGCCQALTHTYPSHTYDTYQEETAASESRSTPQVSWGAQMAAQAQAAAAALAAAATPTQAP